MLGPRLSAVRFIACFLLAGLCGACNERQFVSIDKAEQKTRSDFDLAIVGYNYTDREIGILSVDGVGGGNINLSSTSGGGGGITCCVKLLSGKEPSHHVVRWDAAACKFNEKTPGPLGPRYQLHYVFKELNVAVQRQGNQKPDYFEVHFFPDGSVKTMVTSELSLPLIVLPDGRKEAPTSQCPGNIEPQTSS